MTEIGSSPALPHPEGETEAQREEVTLPQEPRKSVAEPSPDSFRPIPAPGGPLSSEC